MKLPSVYEPTKYETDIYTLWEKSGAFAADPNSQKPRFSISMPPPNETGSLHIGHAIGLTLQDLMCRRARQEGKDVLWLPGTDHAALAVNAIMEKKLAEQGTDKHKVGREEFLKATKEFVASSRTGMNAQIRAMGSSCDWGRARYTLDEALNRCVNEVFVKMFNDGLIYRGHRIVNWDPALETTVSDDEVIHQEEKTPLYTLKFGPFEISTARPETKFGDKYVVMHPDDQRYSQYHDGDQFEADWLNGKITATVVKDEAVDPEFGTGVMTITPWHDHTDFDIAERHGLEKDQIIGFDGRLLPVAGDFAGLTINEARPKIIEMLKAKDLIVDIDENYIHSIALNDRGKGVIEPQIMLQWFVDVNRPAVEWKGQKRSFKEVMRSVIDDGDIKLVPQRFEKLYFHWIDNLRDWCISRQIWWGHQVPVWYKGDDQYVGVLPPEGSGWKQDPDTLDTWFSSALWTWSTLVDQEKAKDYSLSLQQLLQASQDYRAYHPTSVMETGWDILFFWVARMILATTYATGEIPFKTVYLHGLVRTEQGKKMSKSNPESIIEPGEVIKEFGADALRLALISGVSAGADLRLGKSKIVTSRNFSNKLWNIARYTESVVGQGKVLTVEPQSLADHWILNKLSISANEIDRQLKAYRFSDAYDALYHFVWDDLADWYIEASKVQANSGVLAHCLKSALILTHPFAPFVTEAIWQNLGWENNLLASLNLPIIPGHDAKAAHQFDQLITIVKTIRRIAKGVGIAKPVIEYKDDELISGNVDLVKSLSHAGQLERQHEKRGLRLPIHPQQLYLLDVNHDLAQAYQRQLLKEASELKNSINLLKKRLDNKTYVNNAPEETVEESRSDLAHRQKQAPLLDEEVQMIADWLERN